MTETAAIDYEIAFEELSTLNTLFQYHTDAVLPAFNPDHFEAVETERSFTDVVIRGRRTGIHYLSTRSLAIGAYSQFYQYTSFSRAEPVERSVTDWKTV